MTTDQLYAAIHAHPFRPFSLRIVDGRALQVPHPDFMQHRRNSRIAIVTREDDSFDVVDLLMVAGLEYTSPTATEA